MLALRNPMDTQQTDTQGIRSCGAPWTARSGSGHQSREGGTARGRRPAPARPRPRRSCTRSKPFAQPSARKRWSVETSSRSPKNRLALLFCALVAAAPSTRTRSKPHRPISHARSSHGGTLDGPEHRVRCHAHRGDQPGGRGCRRGCAARNTDRRQGSWNGQPDRLGRRPAQPVRRRRRTGNQRCSSSSSAAVSRREHPVGISDQAIILSGSVSSNAVMLRVGEIAQATLAQAEVINMLQLPAGPRASR